MVQTYLRSLPITRTGYARVIPERHSMPQQVFLEETRGLTQVLYSTCGQQECTPFLAVFAKFDACSPRCICGLRDTEVTLAQDNCAICGAYICGCMHCRIDFLEFVSELLVPQD